MRKIYYNQADGRWATHPYPSSAHPNATVKSGGCGVTCAAMVVSSSGKETIYPNKMADISKSNGYRAAEGTSFSFFSYVAKRWGLETKTVKSSYEAHQACKDGYFVVISCGAGLWTTSGHYILAVGADGKNIEIYDPYLYNGKFNINGRAGKVTLKGNSAWVNIDTFKQYSNAQSFYAFKINGKSSSNSSSSSSSTATKTMYVNTSSASLNVRKDAKSDAKIVGTLSKGTKVTVYEEKSGWSRIGNDKWVNSKYLSSSKPSSSSSKTTTKTMYVTASGGLNVRPDASSKKAVIKTLPKGTKITVYEEKNGWSRIGKNQWVSSQYLSSKSSSSSDSSKPKTTTKTVSTKGNSLNVRSGAGTKYAVVGTIKKGKKVTVYETKNGWSRIGDNKWVSSQYLK